MSNFIKVTEAVSGRGILVNAANIISVEDRLLVWADGLEMEILETLETLEQIEAQLLRDEIAKTALLAILSNPSVDELEAKHVAHDVYMFADAMLKERMK